MEGKLISLLLTACLVGASNSVRGNSLDVHLIASYEKENRSEVPCPSVWVISASKTKCFGYIASSQSWDDSETHFNGCHGHLAALISFQELTFVQNLCGEVVNGCWVGGIDINSLAGFDWEWSDNTSYWNESIIVMGPLHSTCTNLSCYNNTSIELCTLVANGTISLVAERCNRTHSFICTLDIENKCYRMHCHGEYLIIHAVLSGLILCTTLAIVIWLLVYKRSKRVAVKRLKRSSFQRKKEFYFEIGRAARLHHPNLVAVKGCCYDHGDCYMVYEFIVNGPLDRLLHHVPKGGKSLDCAMRMKVATTLAQGIAFLMKYPTGCASGYLTSNMLLDEDFGAHLMGVGLMKFVPWEVMQERTVIAGGMYQYLAPEFVYSNELTTKSDVYSFGVLLLEIVSGRRPAQAVDLVGWQSIFEWATPLVQAHCYPVLLDPLISSSSSSQIPETGVIQKVVELVYACTQHVPSMRPIMSRVVHQLPLAQPSIIK